MTDPTLASHTKYRIDLAWEGEGWSGDYDPSDPEDEQLMRFTLLERLEDGTWQQVEDCSYCTRLILSDMQANNGYYKRLAETVLCSGNSSLLPLDSDQASAHFPPIAADRPVPR